MLQVYSVTEKSCNEYCIVRRWLFSCFTTCGVLCWLCSSINFQQVYGNIKLAALSESSSIQTFQLKYINVSDKRFTTFGLFRVVATYSAGNVGSLLSKAQPELLN